MVADLRILLRGSATLHSRATPGEEGVVVGQGRRGVYADDEWRYNCGGVGRWRDDCDDARVPPNDHSVFSAYNVMKCLF
ncbi:hypothetical protein BJ165DRAFT_1509331 [Panaeolus papilionaceus]|nr:hypothetical protein BJ165DRAFT_1509331 [Panaeolus papilionaceus]